MNAQEGQEFSSRGRPSPSKEAELERRRAVADLEIARAKTKADAARAAKNRADLESSYLAKAVRARDWSARA